MSILKTKPRWAPTAVATKYGWQDPVTREIYVSIGGLDAMIEAENAVSVESVNVAKEDTTVAIENTVSVEAVEQVQTNQNEEIMNTPENKPKVEEQRTKRTYIKKPKMYEQTQEPVGVQIIGEVVEHDLDKQVIGE